MQTKELDELLNGVYPEYVKARDKYMVDDLRWLVSQDVFIGIKSLLKRIYIIDTDKVALSLWDVEVHVSHKVPKRTIKLQIKGE